MNHDARASGSGEPRLTRRGAVLAISAGLAGSAALALAACSRRPAGARVVLYSSVDDYLLRDLLPRYEAATGVRVEVVGDTEATKSTGLAERVIAERARPRADVWWSSEPFFTIRLARDGLLEPGAARAALGEGVAPAWPTGLVGGDGSWVGLANRARVIVSRTSRVPDADVPRRLADLADPRWKGRVAMARPEFGTTRGHLAALLDADGADAVERWLRAMVENGLRIYAGNSMVVRAIAQGEADLGLTDTDDVWAGQRNGWEVSATFERADPIPAPTPADADPADAGPTPVAGSPSTDAPSVASPLVSHGPLVLPNTAGLVRGGPNPEGGRRLLAWILGGDAERALAASESRNYPVHPGLADIAINPPLPADAWQPSLERVADHLDEAAAMGARVLDG